MTRRSLSLISTVAAASFLAFFVPDAASAADDYFAGKTIRVVVPSGSGGTYHLYCQLLSRHLGKHIPGNPTVVTQNRPGAGGAKAARYMVTAAPKDGSEIAMINPGSITLPLLRPGVGFDTREMAWLGSMSGRAYTVGVWYESPVQTLAEAKKKKVIMGTTGKSATSYLIPSFMNAVLGTKFEIITGYKGGGAINLAIERGEVWGRGNFYSGYTVRPEWLREGKIKFFVSLGPKIPALKDVPRLADLMKTDLQKEMLSLLEVSFKVAQAFYAPPEIPKEHLSVLRKAFWDTMQDPELKATAEEHGLPLNSLTHEQVEQLIGEAFNASPEAAKKLASILGFDKQ